ncbi:hypothetical protein ACXPWS_05270 [Mycobacterium sp. BMJ-28]
MNLAWLIAVIEPDLLTRRGHAGGSPLSPSTELAKAMQGRIHHSLFEEPVQDVSIRAIFDALGGDDSAVDVLIDSLATDSARHDLAKLTALTLVACALLSDRDDGPTCFRLIDNALELIDDHSPSDNLCRMLILQQRALRSNDIGGSTESHLNEVRRLIEHVEFDSSPELALRADAEVTPDAAIENLLDALRSASAGFSLSLPSFDMGYLTDDLEDDQLGGYRRWLDNTFRIKMSRAIPTDYGPDHYFENLRLEVLGHREVYRSRRELATMRLVRFMPTLPAAVADDGLRLLRLAGADAELRLLVNDLTFAGPISALLADGRRIESTRTSDHALRTGEMIVLAAASEVMAPAEAFKTLTRVLSLIRRGGPTTAPLHWQADFSKDEDAWIAAVALAAAAGTAGELARELLEYATPDRLDDQAFDSVIAKIVRRIEWSDVDTDLKDLWLALTTIQTSDGRTTDTSAAIRSAFAVGTDLAAEAGGSLNDVAENINHYLRTETPLPEYLYETAKRAALAGLAQAANEAAAHTFAVRTVQPAEIVAVLLSQSSDDEAWTGLLEFLVNPLVARRAKSRAFDVLVRELPFLPEKLALRYRDQFASLITEPDRWAFDGPYSEDVFVEGLAFAYAYEFLSHEIAAQYFRALTSSPDAQIRRQAGRHLSLLSASSLPDWMLAMVFALSSDPDPRVRFAITGALSTSCQRHDAIGEMAIERLSEFLQSDGIYVPLNTLTQLEPVALRAPKIERVVNQLRNDSQSWRVRKRASQLLN